MSQRLQQFLNQKLQSKIDRLRLHYRLPSKTWIYFSWETLEAVTKVVQVNETSTVDPHKTCLYDFPLIELYQTSVNRFGVHLSFALLGSVTKYLVLMILSTLVKFMASIYQSSGVSDDGGFDDDLDKSVSMRYST